MSELREFSTFQTPSMDALRDHLKTAHLSGYTDIEALEQFVGGYNRFSAAITTDEHLSFLEQLDIPEIGFVFDEEVFDTALAAYDRLASKDSLAIFPNTGRVPSGDWQQELRDMLDIFDPDYQVRAGRFHPDVLYAPSHAKYVQQNYKEFKASYLDTDSYYGLVGNSFFLKAIHNVFSSENMRSYAHIDSNNTKFDPEFICDILIGCGYAFADSYREDWTYKDKDGPKETIESNLRSIAMLEMERPGSVRLLSGFYGIRHFNTYPLDLLIAQVDTHESQIRPYGVMISAVNDHNGAYISSPLFNASSTNAALYKNVSRSHDLKVCEAASPHEFTQRLRTLNSHFGNAQKINFAIIHAHGNESALGFGNEKPLGSTALRNGFRNYNDIFTSDATILITGCSTGVEGGIAQKFSKQFRTTVIAPEAVAAISRIGFSNDHYARLTPHFIVPETQTEVTALVYKDGELVGTI